MANSSNEYLPNYVEHIVPLQEKKYSVPRKLALVGVAVGLLALILVLTITSFLQYLGGAVFLLLLGCGILIWYLSRFASVEYEYVILGGEIRIETVYGRMQRKHCYDTSVSRVEKIAPVAGQTIEASAFEGVTKTLFCASTMDNPRTHYLLIREENGEKTLLFLELTEKGEKVLRFLCRRAFC